MVFHYVPQPGAAVLFDFKASMCAAEWVVTGAVCGVEGAAQRAVLHPQGGPRALPAADGAVAGAAPYAFA